MGYYIATSRMFFFLLLWIAASAEIEDDAICDYKTDLKSMADLLSECINRFSDTVTISIVANCLYKSANFEQNQTINTPYVKMASNFFINSKDYEICSKNFNKLLDSIRYAKVNEAQITRNEILNRTKSTARAGRLIKDSIKYQKDFCKNFEEYKNDNFEGFISSANINIRKKPATMYVYKSEDIVSDSIRTHGYWENKELSIVLRALRRYRRLMNIKNPNDVTFLDIGSQVGWYMMQVGGRGYNVMAFEPMDKNSYILRKNICLNQSMKVTFIQRGLSERRKNCFLFTGQGNVGDPSYVCDPTKFPTNYINVGSAESWPLDNFKQYIKNLAMIKMDVEGCEYNVTMGGKSIFFHMHVPYIMMEYSPKMLRDSGTDPLKFIRLIMDSGYIVSRRKFNSRRILSMSYFESFCDTKADMYQYKNINLFLTHKSFAQHA